MAPGAATATLRQSAGSFDVESAVKRCLGGIDQNPFRGIKMNKLVQIIKLLVKKLKFFPRKSRNCICSGGKGIIAGYAIKNTDETGDCQEAETD